MLPLSILCRPTSDLSSTVLPDPLWPMIRFVMPGENSAEMSSSTMRPSKDFTMCSARIMLCEKDLGENQVENQNHDAAHDDRLRTGAAYLERVAVGVIAVKT